MCRLVANPFKVTRFNIRQQVHRSIIHQQHGVAKRCVENVLPLVRKCKQLGGDLRLFHGGQPGKRGSLSSHP